MDKDTKNLYSIGEVSKLMNVTVQTLRYYSKLSLIDPVYINPETGYRFYSAEQFTIIDRIKYLQKLGFTLEEIRSVIRNNNIEMLQSRLDERRAECDREIAALNRKLAKIEWYESYYSHAKITLNNNVYIKHLPTRWMVAVKCLPNEPKLSFHVRLFQKRNDATLGDLSYYRQFAYVLEETAFMQNEFSPKYLGMYLQNKPGVQSEDILTIPGGNYFCFYARMFSDGWAKGLEQFFTPANKQTKFVLANEYEDNFKDYNRSIYEIQILV